MSEMEESRARIEVEGTPYVLPALDTFDLDEAMILYRYSDLTFDQIFELEGLHPGVVAGLIHVAIQRSDPSLREREVKRMVSNVNMMSVLEQLAAMADDAPDPTLAEAPSPEPDSNKSKSEPIASSGISGEDASAPSPEKSSLVSTGQPSSETAAVSDRPTWAP